MQILINSIIYKFYNLEAEHKFYIIQPIKKMTLKLSNS